jgi:hypothetical protein
MSLLGSMKTGDVSKALCIWNSYIGAQVSYAVKTTELTINLQTSCKLPSLLQAYFREQQFKQIWPPPFSVKEGGLFVWICTSHGNNSFFFS